MSGPNRFGVKRFGKKRLPGCTCGYIDTCGVCLKRAADRNWLERETYKVSKDC